MKKRRHKLNMLEPGLVMIKVIAITGLLSLLAGLFKQYRQACFFGIAAILLFIFLIILLIIEQHQDHHMYLEAKKEDPDVK